MSEKTAMSVLTIEVIRDYHDPIAAYSGPRDVRFAWQGIEYRRGCIRAGEPEQFYSLMRLDDDDTRLRLEIFGRAEKDYESFGEGPAKIPPLHRFAFLLPKAPPHAQWWNADAWQDPELLEHEVLA